MQCGSLSGIRRGRVDIDTNCNKKYQGKGTVTRIDRRRFGLTDYE